MHGTALRIACPRLGEDDVARRHAVKKRGDVARHCAAPPGLSASVGRQVLAAAEAESTEDGAMNACELRGEAAVFVPNRAHGEQKLENFE